MTRAWVTAYRWPPTLGISLVLAIVSWAGTGGFLYVLNLNPIRVVWFTLLAGALVAVTPLTPSFGMLGRTFVRARRDRGLRMCGVLLVLVADAAPVTLASSPPAAANWFAALSALSIGSVILLGELGWILTLATGSLSILLEHAVGGFPVSDMLARIPAPLPATLCLMAAVVYVHRGPASS